MVDFIRIIFIEIKKYSKISLKSKTDYFTTFLWPLLVFIQTFYFYKPFSVMSISKWGFGDSNSVLSFLIVGLLAYNCFFSLVRTALFMRREREEGVLEIVLLSPANRMALMYGRAMGALIQNTWMFCIFSVLAVVYIDGFTKNPILLLLVFLLICISACIWGGLINTIFLFSRDAEIIFYILDEPMMLFSGVKAPINIFPVWAKSLSALFPLTYVLFLARGIMADSTNYSQLMIYALFLFFYLLIIIILTFYLLKHAEAYLRENGNVSFY